MVILFLATFCSTNPPVRPTEPSDMKRTFRLCGTADPTTERAIEQLIAGRSYSASLVSRPDGCADLTITVSPHASPGSAGGRQSTSLTTSLGSGSQVTVQIVSEQGATQVRIGR